LSAVSSLVVRLLRPALTRQGYLSTFSNSRRSPENLQGEGSAGRGTRRPTRGSPARRANVRALNYRIIDETELGKGSEAVKFRDNIAAIETLKKIETKGRRPTLEEQRVLPRYFGWGGLFASILT
jgi:hypothetical protein